MSIAQAIPAVTAARAARAAERDAQRATRDAFIVPQFALMSARFEARLADALGLHSLISVSVATVAVPVQNRTFATLNTRVVTVRSTINTTPQTVTFTPQLDFHEQDQFGLIACSIDFPFYPRPARIDGVARTLVEQGIQMRGSTVSSLMLPLLAGMVELSESDLEDAFTAWWLR